MDIFVEVFLAIAVGVITGGFTAFFTFKAALKRFISEKWWEKKAEAYTVILEALHYMNRSIYEEYRASGTDRELPGDRKEELEKKFKEARDELEKRIDIGQFVLSDDAVTELKDFQKNLRNAGSDCPTSWDAYMGDSLDAIGGTLERMRVIAKADLKG